MNLIKSFFVAFAMYSKLPVPQFEWKEENMKYALVCFPFVGVVIGGLEYLWWMVFQKQWLSFSVGLYAAVAAVLPNLITGGIHMDGMMDTADALASYQPKERRLEILKDSHVGAFAVITAIVYSILVLGIFQQEISQTEILCAGFVYVISRAFSALAAVIFPAAKREGTLMTFRSHAQKRVVQIGVGTVIVAGICFWMYCNLFYGVLAMAYCLLFTLYYYHMSMKHFGGITGDLEGWYLQFLELGLLGILVII